MEYLSGLVFDGTGFTEGYVGIEEGIIAEIGDGRPPEKPVAKGTVIPGLVNAHTHSADGLLTFEGRPGIEELVMPPNGLKHRYLMNAADDELILSMRSFTDIMFRTGTTGFVDFREGGRKGAELIRISSPVPNGMILGRPSGRYDANELDDILNISDGIGLSSISDIAANDADAIADHVRKRGKVLAIHVSERVREDIEHVMSLSPSFVVHMTEATDKDMRMCAENNVAIVSCPRSNMFFGRVPPVDRMIASGADVAIGTDNAMLCVPDMRAEASVFDEILKKRGYGTEHTVRSLLVDCRKVLYGGDGLQMRVGMPADIAVLLSSGDPERDITSSQGDAVMTMLGRRTG
ncbi:MAG: amidohydrolase family protein [Methanomassiliicoccaceae archaeon]|jgi:cytosine/adenosine deaminase-related metal-dependent hydrolase|nr:amidohydrolase family protein [Methanomassiliicoccaceae archaeon]